jgi:hypothetical protein
MIKLNASAILLLIIFITIGYGSKDESIQQDGPQKEGNKDSLDLLLSKVKPPSQKFVRESREKREEESDFIREEFGSEDNFIDPDRTVYWKEHRQRDAVYQHIAVFDTLGTLLDSLPDLRGCRVYLKDLSGDENEEIIVSHIEGNAASFFPVTWSVYLLTKEKKLKKILDYPKAYYFLDDSRKHELACFINRYHFHAIDSLRIETIFFAESCLDDEFFPHIDKRSPLSEKETRQFYYDKSAERFILAD